MSPTKLTLSKQILVTFALVFAPPGSASVWDYIYQSPEKLQNQTLAKQLPAQPQQNGQPQLPAQQQPQNGLPLNPTYPLEVQSPKPQIIQNIYQEPQNNGWSFWSILHDVWDYQMISSLFGGGRGWGGLGQGGYGYGPRVQPGYGGGSWFGGGGGGSSWFGGGGGGSSWFGGGGAAGHEGGGPGPNPKRTEKEVFGERVPDKPKSKGFHLLPSPHHFRRSRSRLRMVGDSPAEDVRRTDRQRGHPKLIRYLINIPKNKKSCLPGEKWDHLGQKCRKMSKHGNPRAPKDYRNWIFSPQRGENE